MSKRSALRNGLEATLARVLILKLEYSPRPVANWLGHTCAKILDRAVPRLRRTAIRNLEMAYPDRDLIWRNRIVDGVFASIGRLLVAFARFPRIDRNNVGQWIRYEGFEHYERAVQRNWRRVLDDPS